MSVTSVVLAGVGGQGTILASDVLAKVAAAEGNDVKLSEVHGMSQRGGSVDSVVRFGEHVFSPVVSTSGADHLVAFELVEAARSLPFLKPGGRLLVNTRMIPSLPVLTGAMPAPTGLVALLQEEGAVLLDAEGIACGMGAPKSANVVLLGALSVGLPFAERTWRDVLAARVPTKTIEVNLEAFQAGRDACARGECE